jgi:peptide-methionine (S)-S-oxide reductase
MSNDRTYETITLGGGCFWCLEAAYQQVQGVEKVVSGYAGGKEEEPTYEQVSGGGTGHAEVVQIQFDPSKITLGEILEIFWTIHDPTTLNRQGHDVGTQYRSIILYSDDEQKQTAEDSIRKVQELWPDPLVTEIQPLGKFYPAEGYHQNYFNNHPEQAYCQVVINPKLIKLRQKFESKLKL